MQLGLAARWEAFSAATGFHQSVLQGKDRAPWRNWHTAANDATLLQAAGGSIDCSGAVGRHETVHRSQNLPPACTRPSVGGGRKSSTNGPMATSGNSTRKDCRKRLSRFNEINGRHVGTRTPDLYRVKGASNTFTTTYMAPGNCQVPAKTRKRSPLVGSRFHAGRPLPTIARR
jgi:hypothetical protein